MYEEVKKAKEEMKESKLKLKKLEKENGEKRQAYRFRITKKVVILALPYVVAGAAMAGVCYASGSGLPFVRDSKKQYRQVKEVIAADGSISDLISYSSLEQEENQLVVTSPFQEREDGLYERVHDIYQIDTLDQMTQREVEEGNLEAIEENFVESQTEVKSQLREEEQYQGNQISFIKYYAEEAGQGLETEKENMTFTLIWGLGTIAAGSVFRPSQVKNMTIGPKPTLQDTSEAKDDYIQKKIKYKTLKKK